MNVDDIAAGVEGAPALAINVNHWHLGSSKFPDQLCDVQSVRKKRSPRQRTKRFLQWRARTGRCTSMLAVPKLFKAFKREMDEVQDLNGSDLRTLQGFSRNVKAIRINSSRLRLFISFF